MILLLVETKELKDKTPGFQDIVVNPWLSFNFRDRISDGIFFFFQFFFKNMFEKNKLG